MQAEIVSIGNELLLGATLNTNATFLSRELNQRGFPVHRHIVLPDSQKAIQHGLREALQRVSLVIVTGGLGPTLDDVTQEAVAGLFLGEPKELKNRIGTAPGFLYATAGKALFLLPGVPREMEKMFFDEVLPWMQKHFLPKKQFCDTFSLCFFNESEIDPFLRDLKEEHPEVESGIYPAMGTLQVVLRSDRPMDGAMKKFEDKFPTYLFREKKIEEAVHRELIGAKKTLGLAESCTGGAIAARLTSLPDASYYLRGSIVSYSNDWKERFLRVSSETLSEHGEVSVQVAQAMIDGIFSETDVDYAIAVTGIAGPTGGTSENPVGTIYIGIGKRGERSDIGKIQASRDRTSAIDMAVQWSLSALWRRLVHNTPTFT